MLLPGGQLGCWLTYSSPAVPGTFWNVNLPHLEPGDPDPEVVFCEPSTQPLPVNPDRGEHFHCMGEYALRDRAPGTDVDVCFQVASL